jgi:hypothetical protein
MQEAITNIINNASTSNDCNVLQQYAISQATALIVSRLMVLKHYCSELLADPKFPYYWLLLQIKPTLTNDLFLLCYRVFSKCSPTELFEEGIKLLTWIKEKTGTQLHNFMDEAQILLDDLKDKFEGSVHKSARSLCTPFLQACARFRELATFVAGTGLALRESVQVVTSVYGKSVADVSKRLIVNFGGYTDVISMREYITQFVDIDDDTMDAVFGFLRGISIIRGIT